MESTLTAALTRQHGLRRQMEVIANNLANMNTTGFQSQRMLFREFVVDGNRIGTNDPTQRLSLVIDEAITRDLRPGAMETTGAPLDLALQSDGYFVVETASGPRYTRNGSFKLSTEGLLVDRNGFPVSTVDGNTIQVPDNPGDITISGTGTVTVRPAGDADAEGQQVGQIAVVRFDNEFELDPLGNGLLASNEVATPVANPRIVQGMLERSNVEPITEMTMMIDVSRAYSRASKIVSDEHDRIRRAVQSLGQLRA